MEKVFTESVSIHPNMISHVINAFNEPFIQEKLKSNSLYGELICPFFHHRMDIHRFITIDNNFVVINIKDVFEDIDTLKIRFEFVDSKIGQRIKEKYENDVMGNFTILARSIIKYDTDSKLQWLKLITFDIKDSAGEEYLRIATELGLNTSSKENK